MKKLPRKFEVELVDADITYMRITKLTIPKFKQIIKNVTAKQWREIIKKNGNS